MARLGPPVYVINTSSLVEVTALAGARQRTVGTFLVQLVTDHRLKTTALAWKAVKDDGIMSLFEAHTDELVVGELPALETEIREVYEICGEDIVDDDPTDEDEELWLLALALKLSGRVVSEPNKLSKLPIGCNRMAFPGLISLHDMLVAEGV